MKVRHSCFATRLPRRMVPIGMGLCITSLAFLLAGCTSSVAPNASPEATEPAVVSAVASEAVEVTDPTERPKLKTPDESNLIKREIIRQCDGLAKDVRVKPANDIVEPDDTSPTGVSFSAGYRFSFRLGDSPVEVRAVILDLSILKDSEDPSVVTELAMPSGSGLTPQQFKTVLDAYHRGSGKSVAIAVIRLDNDLGYGLTSPYKTRAGSWPADQCYAIASDLGPDRIDGELSTHAANDVVWLDPSTGTAKYLGQFQEQE